MVYFSGLRVPFNALVWGEPTNLVLWNLSSINSRHCSVVGAKHISVSWTVWVQLTSVTDGQTVSLQIPCQTTLCGRKKISFSKIHQWQWSQFKFDIEQFGQLINHTTLWVKWCSYYCCRLLVSGRLQKEAEFYASFVEGGRTVKEFCQQVSQSQVLSQAV